MKKKSLPQLKEILERQEKLLANKSLVARLPDRSSIIVFSVFYPFGVKITVSCIVCGLCAPDTNKLYPAHAPLVQKYPVRSKSVIYVGCFQLCAYPGYKLFCAKTSWIQVS